MNERIRELIEECTDRHFSECVGGFETFDKEKFAELIVRETMQVVANNLPQNTYLDVADAVIEHFKE